MFEPVKELVSSFTDELLDGFDSQFPDHPDHLRCLRLAIEITCEFLSITDAAYHDIEHSMRVTAVGQEILRGKQMMEGPIDADTWLNVTVSLLMHDIGYVRGVCSEDEKNLATYVIDASGATVTAPEGATDAFLTPYHVDRGQIAVTERFSSEPLLDVESICSNIERTRFPVPNSADSRITNDYPGLVRAADLIGQLSDPHYPQKQAALYHEFVETGTAEKLGYESPADLGKHYPDFYWENVNAFVETGIDLLRKTQAGQEIVAGLFAHVFSEEHNEPAYGPERRVESS